MDRVWSMGPDPEQPLAAIYTFALYAAECKYSVHVREWPLDERD